MPEKGEWEPAVPELPEPKIDRRRLIAGAASLASLAGTASIRAATTSPTSLAPDPAADSSRAETAYRLRLRAAEAQRRLPTPAQPGNGDELAVPRFAACFSKSLPHDANGLVDAAAYQVYLAALRSGSPQLVEQVPLGKYLRLADLQAAGLYDLVGCDSSQIAIPSPPRFASAEQAGELVELQWKARLRDLAFSDYGAQPETRAACDDLSRLSDFRGPRVEGRVTPATLFRGGTAGDLVGPYLSQMLYKPIPYIPKLQVVEQRLRVAEPGRDYLTGYAEWLAVQNGALTDVSRLQDTKRFLRTGRDLSELVHRDWSYGPYLAACLILLGLGTAVDGSNPAKLSRTQSTFVAFGAPFVLAQLAAATQLALKACWYQKFLLHRRLRPEEMAGRVHNYVLEKIDVPLHRDLLDAAVMDRLREVGSYLLSQAYPEGCPPHPSYPAGHAAIAGACVTVLKCYFDESQIVPGPVQPSPDGLSLEPWRGEPLTVGGELDKLAGNISMGRNFAGIHWRSDMSAGLQLGEAVAVDMLRERKLLENDLFTGFSFQSFGGQRVVI